VKIVRIAQPAPRPADTPMMIGDVNIQPLVDPSPSGETRVIAVNFAPGARNRFHTHTFDQILVVTAGRGIIATDEGEQEITVGDVVVIPRSERHWHGATPDSPMTHLAIGAPGESTIVE
jgi:4-carboxymuconolactone decarboxylase